LIDGLPNVGFAIALDRRARLPRSQPIAADTLKAGGILQGFHAFLWVLIIVEQSGDVTLEIASEITLQQAHFQVIDNRVQRGKGCAVRSGTDRAGGNFVFSMDADLSVSASESPISPGNGSIPPKAKSASSATACACPATRSPSAEPWRPV